MTLHYNIATEGVRAGHKILAKLGFGFSIEIIVKPIDTGGGWGKGDIPDLNEYLITVRITHKKKRWEQSFKANAFELKSLEKIMVVYKGINKIIDNISFVITNPMININRIIVKVKRK